MIFGSAATCLRNNSFHISACSSPFFLFIHYSQFLSCKSLKFDKYKAKNHHSDKFMASLSAQMCLKSVCLCSKGGKAQIIGPEEEDDEDYGYTYNEVSGDIF